MRISSGVSHPRAALGHFDLPHKEGYKLVFKTKTSEHILIGSTAAEKFYDMHTYVAHLFQMSYRSNEFICEAAILICTSVCFTFPSPLLKEIRDIYVF